MELKNTTGIKNYIDECQNRLGKIEERLSKLNIDQKKTSILAHGKEKGKYMKNYKSYMEPVGKF